MTELEGYLLNALEQVLGSLDAMAEEGIVAKGSYLHVVEAVQKGRKAAKAT